MGSWKHSPAGEGPTLHDLPAENRTGVFNGAYISKCPLVLSKAPPCVLESMPMSKFSSVGVWDVLLFLLL